MAKLSDRSCAGLPPPRKRASRCPRPPGGPTARQWRPKPASGRPRRPQSPRPGSRTSQQAASSTRQRPSWPAIGRPSSPAVAPARATPPPPASGRPAGVAIRPHQSSGAAESRWQPQPANSPPPGASGRPRRPAGDPASRQPRSHTCSGPHPPVATLAHRWPPSPAGGHPRPLAGTPARAARPLHPGLAFASQRQHRPPSSCDGQPAAPPGIQQPFPPDRIYPRHNAGEKASEKLRPLVTSRPRPPVLPTLVTTPARQRPPLPTSSQVCLPAALPASSQVCLPAAAARTAASHPARRWRQPSPPKPFAPAGQQPQGASTRLHAPAPAGQLPNHAHSLHLPPASGRLRRLAAHHARRQSPPWRRTTDISRQPPVPANSAHTSRSPPPPTGASMWAMAATGWRGRLPQARLPPPASSRWTGGRLTGQRPPPARGRPQPTAGHQPAGAPVREQPSAPTDGRRHPPQTEGY